MSSEEVSSPTPMDTELTELDRRRDDRDNWSVEEINALLIVWKKYVAELDRASHKRIVYKKMSEKLKIMGITRDHFAVQLKINKMKGLYRKSMPTSGHKSKWRFWSAVDEILGEPDSDESSWNDEPASSESDASEPAVQTKKMRAVSTRSTPKRSETPTSIRQKAKSRPSPAPKPERQRKPAPPDEKLDNLLRQDKKLKDHTLRLINLYKDTASRISTMQRSSTENIISVTTELERYLKSRKNDAIHEESVEDKVNALLDNDLTNVSLNSLLPNVFKNTALMPLIKSIVSQFAPPPQQHHNEHCMM